MIYRVQTYKQHHRRVHVQTYGRRNHSKTSRDEFGETTGILDWEKHYLDHAVAALSHQFQPQPSPSMVGEKPELTKDSDDVLLSPFCPGWLHMPGYEYPTNLLSALD